MGACWASFTPSNCISHDNDFKHNFESVLDNTALGSNEVTYIKNRYVSMVVGISTKRSRFEQISRFCRLTIISTGIIVPSLFTVGKIYDDSNEVVFWLTLLLSIISTGCSSSMEIFQINKMIFLYSYTDTVLRNEGWSFAALSGPYMKFRTHKRAYRSFTTNIEAVYKRSLIYINEVSRVTNHPQSYGTHAGMAHLSSSSTADLRDDEDEV